MEDQILLTPEELGKRWKKSVGTLGNWRVQGKGPVYLKEGSLPNSPVMYRLSDVVAFEKEHFRLKVCVPQRKKKLL